MGSENNMVAVPVEPTEAMLDAGYRHVIQRMCELGDKAEMLALWHAMIDAARLASPQPDAQQGEEARGIRINGEPATTEDVLAIGRQLDAEDGGYPTPPSPALDAATIERCAQVARDFQTVADANYLSVKSRIDAGEQRSEVVLAVALGMAHQARQITQQIRALPNAEKRHG